MHFYNVRVIRKLQTCNYAGILFHEIKLFIFNKNNMNDHSNNYSKNEVDNIHILLLLDTPVYAIFFSSWNKYIRVIH